MLEFDLTKLQRLDKVYDLTINIKVLKEGEEDSTSEKSVSLGSDWTDVGIGKYVAARTNEVEQITESIISEREDIPNQDLADPIHVSKATHPTLTNDNVLESLIQEECFQSTGQPYYRCKIHPDIWDIDLEQMKGHCKNEHRD